MKFRFTLTHRGSQAEPLGLPALDQWSTQTGANVEWSEGPAPSVILPGTGPFTPAESEYLYVDYGFEDGVEYSLTLTFNKVYNSGSFNPRLIYLRILDNSFNIQFTGSGSTPASPGGAGSVTINFTANASCTKIAVKASDGSNVTIVLQSISGTGTDPTDVTESIQINEPDGWKEAVMKLARDKEFHSLVEIFDGSFIFYGDNGVVNGGLHFIEFYEISRGLDANIEILIEIAPDDETYETCFEGQLDLSLAERLPKNKFRIPIIRDNFWAKFISRLKTPVDLQSAIDLDGGPIEPVDPVTITLTDQKVTYFSDYNWLYTMTYPDESGDPTLTYLMLAFEEEIRGDTKLFSLARQATDTEGAKVFGLFEAPWNGDYRVQLRVVLSNYDSPDWEGLTTTRLRIRKTNEDSFTVYQFTGGVTDGSDFALIIDIDETFFLSRGEQLSIMLHRASSGTPITVFGRHQLTWLEVDLATTTTTNLSGEETIDGTLTSTSRVLVKNQGNPQENGIYVTAAGAWTRATDMDIADEFNDVAVYVSGGTDQTATAWRQTEPVSSVGIDAVKFVFTEPSDEWQKPFDAVYDTDNYVLTSSPDDPVFTERTTPGSFIKITATTVYPSTVAPGFLIHDAGAGAIGQYGLGGGFYSDLLGSTLTNARQYEADGCAWRYFVTRGLQLRGYTLAEKPYSLSFEQWWKGIDPILCLALWYEEIPGSTIAPVDTTVEDLPDWEDADAPEFDKSVITLEFVNWDSGDPTGTTIDFEASGIPKNEVAVLLRSTSGEFTVEGNNDDAAASYKSAWEADYASGFATISIVNNLVTIEALNYGVIFAAFSSAPPGRINEVISNGPSVGSWNYSAFSYPLVSVNGDGGVSQYTRGLWSTTAGVTYQLSTVVEIFESGSNPTNLTVIWAILDAGFNEIETQQFVYTEDGFHQEFFSFTPSSDGLYLAVRVINDTVSDIKSIVIRLAIGSEMDELLENNEFDSSSDWTNEGAGTDWTIGSGEATVTVATGLSKALTQEFSGGIIGDYYFISEFSATNVGGGESAELTVNFYDSGDILIDTQVYPISSNDTKPFDALFTSIVIATKVEIILEVIAGSGITITIPFAALFVPVASEAVVVPDQQVIRVEEREQVFLEEMSVLISNIEEISRKYDTDKIYNKISIGYNQWKSEDISGIDDPQTKHIYSDRFQKVGQEINVLSDFIAASLAIETTRRQTIEKSTDYKFDNDTFIIAINPDDVSPDSYVPELDENFSSVLNLLNSDTRYNIRISVARNFLRWRKWFNGCLQSYLSSFFRFVSGEGNFDMITTIDQSPDCLGEDNEGQPLSEKQDIDVTDTIVHTPFYYEFEIDMEWETYKTIRENRRNAIGISLTDFGHVPLFIDQLDYQVMGGKAKVTGWTKEYFALDIIEGGAATQDCQTIPPVLFCEDAITDEFGNDLTDENGLCITEEPDEGEGIFDETFDETFE